MKIKSIVFLSVILLISFQQSSSYAFSNHIISLKNIDTNQSASDNDDFEIDFDAIDRELANLPIEEKKPENSWWITKQCKRIGTKIMIKALLGYIALQEYCTEKWQGLSKRMRVLAALCYTSKVEKQYHDPHKS